MSAKTGAERQAAFRAAGRPLSVTLRDPKAIKALDKLTAKHGTVRAAVEAALVHAAAPKAST